MFDQIAEGVRRELAEGTLHVGEHLPPAKDLASALRVNLHTVLRAYAQLRDEGVVEVRRGRGTVIISSGTQIEDRRLNQAVVRLVVEARRRGLSEEVLTNLVLRTFRQNSDYDSMPD
ncbi:GntR family transcriptional regulator [Nonomuraea sp. NPDC002799]